MVVRNAESTDTLRFDATGRPTDAIAVRNGVKYDVTRYYYGDGPLSGLWVRRLTASTWGKLLEPGYDTLGRVTKLPDFGGRLTAIGYDKDGFPKVDTLPTSFRMTATSLYTTGHRLWSTSYPQVATQSVSYSFDALERITSAWRGPSTDRENRLVTYDSLGRVTKYTDVRHWYEQYLVCDDPFVFTCDESEGHWEWAETESVDTLRSATYSYDKVGNRTDHSAVIGSGNRLTSFDGWTLTYDNDGNVTQKSKTGMTQTFTWNAFGQLTQVVVNGVTTTYGYDGLGRRVRKTVNGTTTRYLYDGDNLVVEMDANGAPIRWYSYYPGIDRPHAMVRQSDGARFYYLLEEPGHVAALVNASESRVDRYTYDPFGQSIGTSETVPQAFRFAGREYDAETGLYFMRARYYDPALGRFISEDPIGLAGGINPFAFTANDPQNRTDPSGRSFQEVAALCPLGTVLKPENYWADDKGNEGGQCSPADGGQLFSEETLNDVLARAWHDDFLSDRPLAFPFIERLTGRKYAFVANPGELRFIKVFANDGQPKITKDGISFWYEITRTAPLRAIGDDEVFFLRGLARVLVLDSHGERTLRFVTQLKGAVLTSP